MMRALADAHIPFIAGALNIGDSDHTLALRLAEEVITEQPFAPISSAILEQVRLKLSQVEHLVICPMPIGPGNLALLREALIAAQHGLSVLLLIPQVSNSTYVPNEHRILPGNEITERDYTAGEGLKLLEALLQAGAEVVASAGEAIPKLSDSFA